MCYNTEATLTPMAIFTMVGRPVDHKAVYELTSHSIAFELTGSFFNYASWNLN